MKLIPFQKNITKKCDPINKVEIFFELIFLLLFCRTIDIKIGKIPKSQTGLVRAAKPLVTPISIRTSIGEKLPEL